MIAALLGRKLSHSLSPQIHKFFGDIDYRLCEKEPDEVSAFVREFFTDGERDFLNVTIPYKRAVYELCDELSPMAAKLENVNLVMRTKDGRLFGDNTDAFGFSRLLDSLKVSVRGKSAAVLGAGGAAMTAKAVLEERGTKSVSLIRRDELPSQDDQIIVNATPVGMYPNVDETRVDIAQYPNCEAVIDLVYNPSPTRLIREALSCGKRAADGMVMLLAQAYQAWELMAGHGKTAAETIYLYGPPASGKSTWAKRLAAATRREAVDVDAEIVRRAGCSIAEIFAREGEAKFRTMEKAVLRDLSAAKVPRIVALGGGALLDKENRALVEASGRVVVLDCPIETLKSRLAGADRPLSANPEALAALVHARAAHYASFANVVSL